MPVPSVRVITVFTVFRLLTDFVCLYTCEVWLSLCKIVRNSVILLLPLFKTTTIFGNIQQVLILFPNQIFEIYSNIYFIHNELLACTKLQTISIELYHIWEAYPMYWCTPIEGLYLLNLEVNSCFGIYLYYVDYAFYIQSECVMLYMCYVIVLLTLYIIINNNIFFNYFSLVLGWN